MAERLIDGGRLWGIHFLHGIERHGHPERLFIELPRLVLLPGSRDWNGELDLPQD